MPLTENINTKTHSKNSNGIIATINKTIAKVEPNSIGISIMLITVGSMVASFTAALAVHGEVNLFALIFACVTSMGANAVAISQRPFKVIVWAFIINIVGNIFMIFFQLFT